VLALAIFLCLNGPRHLVKNLITHLRAGDLEAARQYISTQKQTYFDLPELADFFGKTIAYKTLEGMDTRREKCSLLTEQKCGDVCIIHFYTVRENGWKLNDIEKEA
jgi:hypothetical protein